MRILSFMICFALGAFATAQTPRALMNNIPGSPASAVPGQPGQSWAVFPVLPFDDFAMSPDRQRWIASAKIEDGDIDDSCLVFGTGNSTAGAATAARSGTAAPWGQNYENIFLADGIAINNAGKIAFSGDDANTLLSGGQDAYLAVLENGLVARLKRESNLAAGAVPANSFYYSVFGSLHVDDAGAVAHFASTGPNLGSARRTFYVDDTVLFRATSTAIQNLAGTTTTLSSLNDGSLRRSQDGAQSLYVGILSFPGGVQAVVRNGQVLAQRDSILPNSGFSLPINGLISSATFMSPDGQFFGFLGTNTDGVDWVWRNGEVIAKKGEAIVPGSSLNWADNGFSFGFFSLACNNYGEQVIGGITTAPVTDTDAKIVFNGEVVLSEGDAVDVTGDGIVDTGYSIDGFVEYASFLSDGCVYTFIAHIQDQNGARIGQGVFQLELTIPGDINGDGEVGAADFSAQAAAYDAVLGDPNWDADADLNRDGEVGAADFSILAANYDRSR